ncbi:MAG: cytosine permease [Chloroflexota bacterium]
MTTSSMPRMGDMPTREGDLTIESRGIEPIPEASRYGSVNRVFTVWFTPNLVPAAFFIGLLAAAPFLQVGFTTGLIAIVVGNLIGATLVGLLSQMGPATGMAQVPLSRLAYGKSIVVPGILNWISCIGWDGINSVFGAAALSILTGLPFIGSLVILVVIQALLSIVGHEAIHLFEKWMAIVLGVMFAILTVAIAGQASTGIARVDGMTGQDGLGAFVLFASITASFVVAWGLYASDYSRYLAPTASKSKVFWFTVLGLTLSAGWIETLGLLVADKASGGAVDTINSILSGSILAPLAMLAIAIGTIAVNAMNDYTGSLSIQGAGLRIPRVYSAIAVAILGFLFTLYLNSGDLVGKFEGYLLFIIYWVTPWAGVVLADWWMRGGKADVSRLADYASLPSGFAGLASLIIGFVVSLPFGTSPFGDEIAKATGLPINGLAAQLHYADIAYVVGFVVAFGVYWVLAKAMPSKA